MTTTVIKNAAWVIAWDEGLGRHIYRRGIDLAPSRTAASLARGAITRAPRTGSSTATPASSCPA